MPERALQLRPAARGLAADVPRGLVHARALRRRCAGAGRRRLHASARPYMVNILIRAFLYAIVALTVDMLWGYTGILTFGQSAFFGIGAYAAGARLHSLRLRPVASARWRSRPRSSSAAVVARFVGWLAFYHGSSPLYASVVSLVAADRGRADPLFGRQVHRLEQRAVGFESFDCRSRPGSGSPEPSVIAVLRRGLFVLSQRRRPRARRDPRQRGALQLSRHQHLARQILLMVVCAVVAALAGFGYRRRSEGGRARECRLRVRHRARDRVALGGRGTLIGPVIGTLLIDVASAYLGGSLPFVWKLIVGVAFVVVIVVLPGGLLGGLRDASSALRGRSRRRRSAGQLAVALATSERAAVRPDCNDVVLEVAMASASISAA